MDVCPDQSSPDRTRSRANKGRARAGALPGMNRDRWLRVLRWLITAIGCYWIATSLTLDDHLVLPAGFVKDGVVLTAEARTVTIDEIGSETVVIILRGQRIALDRDVVSREDENYRPGLRSVVSGASLEMLIIAALLVWPAQVFLMERWWQLMAAKGLRFARNACFASTWSPISSVPLLPVGPARRSRESVMR